MMRQNSLCCRENLSRDQITIHVLGAHFDLQVDFSLQLRSGSNFESHTENTS
jgi:hypothetical protein